VGAANQTTRLGYDNNDNLEVIVDALGRETNLSFDGLNRLISLTDALQGESTFTYDASDNLTQVTDAEGVITRYSYDGLNNLLAEESTARGTISYSYDAAGNRISTLDANGVEANYDYEALNRLIAVRYPASPQENIEYHYDEGDNGIGRLTSIEDPSGGTAFEYDDRGNLVTDHRVIGGIAYTTRYTYNLANQLVKLVYPSGRIVHYQLDDRSRVVIITTQANAASPIESIASGFHYLPFGPARTWKHGNGLETDIAYDRDYRVTDIDVGDQESIVSLDYQYNDASNITAMLDNLGLNSQEFGYDELNRLTSASGNYGEIGYRYDGVGNRLNRTITTDEQQSSEDYQYQPISHRLTGVTTSDSDGSSTRELSHDNNGNTISDLSPARQLEMIVNARNRLKEVWKDGEQVGAYQYNALGQRVSKTSVTRGRLHAQFDSGNKDETPASDSASNDKGHGKGNDKGSDKGKDNGQSDHQVPASDDNLHSHYDNKKITERFHFHYDQSGNLIAESDEQGNVIREYIYLGSYRIAMAATSIEQGSAQPNKKHSLELYFIHNDHLGTPNKITDANQRVVWSIEQTPFGEVNLTTEAIQMPMRFPGQYADLESGLNYNYFRDYDPSLGRYIQSDPIRLQGGPNVFAYVAQSPLTNTDPSGTIIVPILIAVSVDLTGQLIRNDFDLGKVDIVELIVASILGGVAPSVGQVVREVAIVGKIGVTDTVLAFLGAALVKKYYDWVPPEQDGPYGRIVIRIEDLFPDTNLYLKPLINRFLREIGLCE
jgi:RHS repeat-associated protein